MNVYQDALSTLIGSPQWRRVHPRVMDHPGDFIDIGCYGWAWDHLSNKRTIGYDPRETTAPEWATLHQKLVVPNATGESSICEAGLSSSKWVSGNRINCQTVSIGDVLQERPEPSLIKLNIEGDEYGLLHAHPHPWADQLAIAFHDWVHPRWEGLSHAYLSWLSRWYMPICTDETWMWWLLIKR